VGGLVGDNNAGGTVQKGIASGTVAAAGDFSSNVGGFLGVNEGMIQNVRASGDVTGPEEVGGLIGENNQGTVRYAMASGTVDGTDIVGGLVGRNTGGKIEQTFAVGAVDGSAGVGGLVANNTGFAGSGIINDSYWDIESTNQDSSAGVATGLTTAEMQGEAATTSMNGLDFQNIWATTNEYPALRALPEPDEDGGSGGGSGGGGAANTTAGVTGEDVTVAPDGSTTIEFSLTNTGEENNSYILDLSGPQELTPIAYTNASGTLKETETKWLWQTIAPGETVTPTVTVRAAPDATGQYTVTGEVLTSEAIVAETNVTVDVTTSSSFEVTELTSPATASVATPFTYTAEVTNNGGERGTQSVTATFAGEVVETRNITLNSSEQTTVAFTTESATPGVFEARVATADDTRQASVEVVGQEFIRGQSTGDPHITTYGGVSYDFMAAGDFVLATEPAGDLHVVARQAPIGNSISNNNMTATSVSDARVVIDAESSTPVSIDGSAISITDGDRQLVDDGAGAIARQGSTYTVYYAGEDGDVTATDEHLTVDVVGDRLDIELALHANRSQPVAGLLGNTTAPAANDIVFENGTSLSRPVGSELLYDEYRSDWRATGQENLFADSFYIETFPENTVSVEDLAPADRTRAEALLANSSLVEGTPQYRDALIDVALTGDSSYIASAQKVTRQGVAEANTPVSITEAIDANGNDEIGDAEILTAIDYWQAGEAVPGTDGKTIGDFDVLELIEIWRYNEEI